MNSNQKTVADLIAGETLLVNMKKVNGGKIQVEVAEVFPGRESESAASLLNEDDERFNKKGARRAWIAGTPASIKKHLGIELAEGEESKELNILNPKSLVNGKRLRVIQLDTIKGNETQMADIEKFAKRAGKNGRILYYKGAPIFGNTDAVFTNEEPKHTILISDPVEGSVAAAAVTQETSELTA